MKIISSVHMDDEFVMQLKNEFSDYRYSKKLVDLPQETLANAEVLVTYGYDLPAEMVEQLESLKWIHIMQSGINNLPFSELIDRDILVTNAKGINSVTISEYTMGMMLNLSRKSFVFYEAQKRREWDLWTEIDELSGKTVGLLGYGSIGRELAKRAKAFDMRVLALKRTSTDRPENVDELLSQDEKNRIFEESDFVISLLPLTPKTEGSIGAEELGRMKKSAYLFNVSRGEIVDESALISSLKSGKFAGAVLDVFPIEPLPSESQLWELDNVYITPHIAGDHFPLYMSRAFEILMHNLRNYQQGTAEMKNIVNKEQGY